MPPAGRRQLHNHIESLILRRKHRIPIRVSDIFFSCEGFEPIWVLLPPVQKLVASLMKSNPSSSAESTRYPSGCLIFLCCCEGFEPHNRYIIGQIVIWRADFRPAIVGAATSRPQRNGTARLVEWHAIRTHCRGGSQPPAFVPGQKCSVEWYHVRHSTNSPKLIRDCRFVPRGRLRASPTVLSWCCGNSPNPVHHFWLVLRGRLVAAPTVAGRLSSLISFICPVNKITRRTVSPCGFAYIRP